jgi:hypothetical protein
MRLLEDRHANKMPQQMHTWKNAATTANQMADSLIYNYRRTVSGDTLASVAAEEHAVRVPGIQRAQTVCDESSQGLS